jgi:hypothetical protein
MSPNVGGYRTFGLVVRTGRADCRNIRGRSIAAARLSGSADRSFSFSRAQAERKPTRTFCAGRLAAGLQRYAVSSSSAKFLFRSGALTLCQPPRVTRAAFVPYSLTTLTLPPVQLALV